MIQLHFGFGSNEDDEIFYFVNWFDAMQIFCSMLFLISPKNKMRWMCGVYYQFRIGVVEYRFSLGLFQIYRGEHITKVFITRNIISLNWMMSVFFSLDYCLIKIIWLSFRSSFFLCALWMVNLNWNHTNWLA